MQYGSKNISKVQYGSKNIIAAYWGSKKVWENVPLEDLTENYCTIEALENGLTVSFSTNSLLYSLDNGNSWTELPANTSTPAINSGDKISFKATVLTPNLNLSIGTFTVNKKFNLKGNVMSMLFGDEGKNSYDLTGYNFAFAMLFNNCTTLQSVSKDFLPATTLADLCYVEMFGGCTSLTTSPSLPATTLTRNCYTNMFRDCTSLTQAPELPATTLASYCYANMFNRCTSLVTAPELPATTLVNSCYDNMFAGCSSLTTSPSLPATTLTDSCYYCMFAGCSSMTTSPSLPATTLANLCYADMFAGTNALPDCTNIDFTSESVVSSGGLKGLFSRTKITDEDLYNILPINPSTGKYWLPATTLTMGCYNGMFQYCTSLVTAPELPATTLAEYCYQYMFSDCTSLVTAPELPATTLVYNCYYNMFSGCTSLNYIKALFTTTPSSSYTSNWVNSVSNTGTFVKNVNATWDVTGVNGIPEGWTVETVEDYYLTIEALEDDLTVSFSTNTIQYSIDNCQTWNELTAGTTTPVINTGDMISFKATGLVPNPSNGIGTFTVNKKFNLKGNVMSLLFGDEGKNIFSLSGYDYAFTRLFAECTTLQSVSKDFLPAVRLVRNCYELMFYNCTSLITVPKLQATLLDMYCYLAMFYGCSSLVTAPELPATTLAIGCYASMFNGCGSLFSAPELSAITLAPECYISMFNGCIKLNYIKALFTELYPDSTNNWVNGVSSTGTFVKNADATWNVTGVNGIPEGWTVKTIEDDYLTIEALDDNLKVSFTTNTIQYSTDNCQTWTELPAGTTTPAINAGKKISFKATGLVPTSDDGIGRFKVNTKFNLKGNAMSMLFGDEGKNSFDLTGYDYALCKLFRNCNTLQSVSKNFLPATTLSQNCYSEMFVDCTSLVTAPELPATTLAYNCYKLMFWFCTSLTTTPTLPATELAEYCYSDMFSNCTSLTTILELPATTLSRGCYSSMFSSCTSLVTSPKLPATTLSNSCYHGMFSSCTSLVTSPKLPATTLANSCYNTMFYNCTSLVTAPELPATILDNYCYQHMFSGCTSLVSVPELPATILTLQCYYGMFKNCTSLVTAPELPTTSLVEGCYKYMFQNCSKLNYIKALFTTEPSSTYTSNWVNGVSSTGTFVKSKDATWDVTGVDGIPEGWTVVDYVESNLITFTIDGTEYQAEEGMTWGEWVNSEYNTSSDISVVYTGVGEEYIVKQGTFNNISEDNRNVIQSHCVIKNNFAYIIMVNDF